MESPSERTSDAAVAWRVEPRLEPRLAPTLRLLIALPLVVLLVPLALGFVLPEEVRGFLPAPEPAGAPFLMAEAITLLLLTVPWAARRLGRWFLPLVLLFCTLGPLATVAAHLVLYTAAGPQSLGPALPVFGLQGIWPLTFFLTIPLIVIAWQYDFRTVAAYVGVLLLVDLALAGMLAGRGQGEAAFALLQLGVGRTVVFLANGYLVAQLVGGQRQGAAALAAANRQLVQYAQTQEELAVSRERNRLARDLHDTLAHYLSGLVLELEGTRLLWDGGSPEARPALDNAIGTAREGLVETRRALGALRASPLEDLGLRAALRLLAETMAARNRWALRLELPGAPYVLPPVVEETLYRVAQEGLTNVERHARAQAVSVGLRVDGGGVLLRIEDDGVGFAARGGGAEQGAFGLVGMQERSRLIGGVLEIGGGQGKGTVLTLAAAAPFVGQKGDG